MIALKDISSLMQRCAVLGYVFMFSPSGTPDSYNIYMAYMPKLCDNRSLRLSFDQERKIIFRYADENSEYAEFHTIQETIQYAVDQLEAFKQAEAI